MPFDVKSEMFIVCFVANLIDAEESKIIYQKIQ